MADTYGAQAWAVVRQSNPQVRFLRVRFRKEGIPDGVPVLFGTSTLTCGTLTYQHGGQRYRDGVVALFNGFGVEGLIYCPNRFCAPPQPIARQPPDPAIQPAPRPAAPSAIEVFDAYGAHAATFVRSLYSTDVVTRLAFEPAFEWEEFRGRPPVPVSCGFVTISYARRLQSIDPVAVVFAARSVDGAETPTALWGGMMHGLCLSGDNLSP